MKKTISIFILCFANTIMPVLTSASMISTEPAVPGVQEALIIEEELEDGNGNSNAVIIDDNNIPIRDNDTDVSNEYSTLTQPRIPTDTETDSSYTNDNIAGQALELFNTSPALFVKNQGQWSDPTVRYVHDGSFANVAITDSGIMFQVTRSEPQEDSNNSDLSSEFSHNLPLEQTDIHSLQFKALFVGANEVQPIGQELSKSLFNYFIGVQSNWRENVPSYELVTYQNLYNGIDLQIQGLRSHLKYEFHVAPGADWSQIAIKYEGIKGLSISEDGSLLVDLGSDWGVMRDDAPYIYQEIDGMKVLLSGCFIVLDNQTYTFEITGDFDPAHPLVIDPDLAWSTYLGGTDFDTVGGICVDTAGNLYVTGVTDSSGWVSGGYDAILNGSDGYVVKLTRNGSHVWSTYIGGDGTESWLGGVAVDGVGFVYATGMTNSPGWVSGGFDTTSNGPAFAVKLTSTGTHVWSTYLSGADRGVYGIAVDGSGGIYVTGSTSTAGWASGGFDTSYNGGEDVFVMKLSAAGGHVWSTYLGGAGYDGWSGDIAVDPCGCVYVTGATGSADWVSGGFDITYNGGLVDTFVARLTASGEHAWSTYLGGSETELPYGIAVDGSGGVYVTGVTNSSGWVSGGFDTTMDSTDAFVVKLTGAGAHSWSTYVGGSGSEYGKGISVDATSRVYVTGQTNSVNWTSGGFDMIHDGGWDVFVARLTDAGVHVWSSYLGGSADEDADRVVAAEGVVYVAGYTLSENWVADGFDTTYNGGGDAFMAKITDQLVGDFCSADFTGPDGYVDVWDLMQFADHWHTRTGDADWDAKFDLTGPDFEDIDSYADVWDLMVFADNWHKGQKP